MSSEARFAGPTIRGYCYQFDRTLLATLNAADDEFVVAEYLEDITIESPNSVSGIQCKYLASAALTSSAIRDPVCKMLDAFCERPAGALPVEFRLYIYCAKVGVGFAVPADVQAFKEFLTFTQNKVQVQYDNVKGYSDLQLQGFLDSFSLDQGVEFEEQQQAAYASLAEVLGCDTFEVDLLYYHRALSFVIQKSIAPNLADRRFKKLDLLTWLKVKDQVFNRWFLAAKGEAALVISARRFLKNEQTFRVDRNRVIVLGQDYTAHSLGALAAMIKEIALDHYSPEKSLHSSKPLTFVLGMNNDHVVGIKQQLQRLGVQYNDGYEHVKFWPESFRNDPIVVRKRNDKISQTSYVVRLVSLENYRKIKAFSPSLAVFMGGIPDHNLFPAATKIYTLPCLSINQTQSVLSKP